MNHSRVQVVVMNEQSIPVDAQGGDCKSRPSDELTGGLEGTSCLFFVPLSLDFLVPLSLDFLVKSLRQYYIGLPD